MTISIIMKFITVILFAISTIKIYSQDYTMFWNTKSLVNPANSGLEDFYAAINGRIQWLGLNGSPRFTNAIVDYRLNNINSGIGINYYYLTMAYTKINMVNLNYSYQLKIGDKVLSFGISGGYGQEKIELSKLRNSLDYDPAYAQDEKIKFINYKFGIYYLSNHFELGLSSTNSKYSGNTIYAHDSGLYWLYTTYKIDLNENVKLSPNIMLNGRNLKDQFSISTGLFASIKNRLWTGVSFKTFANSHSIGAFFGYNFAEKLRIGYSYDFHTAKFFHKYGNHEFILAYVLK